MLLCQQTFIMRITILSVFSLAVFMTSCRKQVASSIEPPTDVYSVEFLNQRIASLLRQRGTVHWCDLDVQAQWSAIVHADSLVAIGYKPAVFVLYPDWISDVHLQDPEWLRAREALLSFLENEGLRP